MTQLIKGGGLQNHPQEKASHPHCLLNKGGNSFIPPQGTFWNSSSTQLNHFKNYTIIKETRHPTNKHATNNPIIKIHSPSNQILIATRDLIPQSFLGESTARSVVGSLQLSTTRSKFDETGFGKTIADLQAFEKTILRCLPSLEMNNSIFTSLVRVNPFDAEKTTSFFLNLRLFQLRIVSLFDLHLDKKTWMAQTKNFHYPHWNSLFLHGEFSAANHARNATLARITAVAHLREKSRCHGEWAPQIKRNHSSSRWDSGICLSSFANTRLYQSRLIAIYVEIRIWWCPRSPFLKIGDCRQLTGLFELEGGPCPFVSQDIGPEFLSDFWWKDEFSFDTADRWLDCVLLKKSFQDQFYDCCGVGHWSRKQSGFISNLISPIFVFHNQDDSRWWLERVNDGVNIDTVPWINLFSQ